jgi:hypothetical protein
MNVTRNSLPDPSNQSPPAGWPVLLTRLRQRYRSPAEDGAATAGPAPNAAAVDSAATMPSWPRIFPGL